MKTKETGERDSLGFLISSKKIIIGIIFIPFVLLMGFSEMNLTSYFNTKKIYKRNNLSITQGYVHNYKIFFGKHDNLEFYINNDYFVFGDNMNNYSCRFKDIDYNEIKDSSYLKISYVILDQEKIILKVEKE